MPSAIGVNEVDKPVVRHRWAAREAGSRTLLLLYVAVLILCFGTHALLFPNREVSGISVSRLPVTTELHLQALWIMPDLAKIIRPCYVSQKRVDKVKTIHCSTSVAVEKNVCTDETKPKLFGNNARDYVWCKRELHTNTATFIIFYAKLCRNHRGFTWGKWHVFINANICTEQVCWVVNDQQDGRNNQW